MAENKDPQTAVLKYSAEWFQLLHAVEITLYGSEDEGPLVVAMLFSNESVMAVAGGAVKMQVPVVVQEQYHLLYTLDEDWDGSELPSLGLPVFLRTELVSQIADLGDVFGIVGRHQAKVAEEERTMGEEEGE